MHALSFSYFFHSLIQCVKKFGPKETKQIMNKLGEMVANKSPEMDESRDSFADGSLRYVILAVTFLIPTRTKEQDCAYCILGIKNIIACMDMASGKVNTNQAISVTVYQELYLYFINFNISFYQDIAQDLLQTLLTGMEDAEGAENEIMIKMVPTRVSLIAHRMLSKVIRYFTFSLTLIDFSGCYQRFIG